mmetsp:Transcript_32960/g.88409  ORF Transcript_32960/g.88409 Transcript_32960/m.88409 type:complete len:234 (-) Transcript_32960:242-943(-)
MSGARRDGRCFAEEFLEELIQRMFRVHRGIWDIFQRSIRQGSGRGRVLSLAFQNWPLSAQVHWRDVAFRRLFFLGHNVKVVLRFSPHLLFPFLFCSFLVLGAQEFGLYLQARHLSVALNVRIRLGGVGGTAVQRPRRGPSAPDGRSGRSREFHVGTCGIGEASFCSLRFAERDSALCGWFLVVPRSLSLPWTACRRLVSPLLSEHQVQIPFLSMTQCREALASPGNGLPLSEF